MSAHLNSIQQVLNLIQQRNKDVFVDPYDIVDNAYQVLHEVGNLQNMWYYDKVELEINDDQLALLPCNTYKVDYVYINSRQANPSIFTINEKSIRFHKPKEEIGHVTVDIYVIPSDEDGIPIFEGSELMEAIYWYWLYYYNMDRYLNGDLPQNRWQFIEEKKDFYMQRAEMIYRRLTKNHKNKLHKIMLNVRPKINMPSGRSL